MQFKQVKDKQNYTTFYLMRHGETEWNQQGLIQGQEDSPLTKLGLIQAKEAAQKFKSFKFDLAFSSDLLRAKRTAEIIALEHKLEVEASEMLRERRFGHLEGKPGQMLRDLNKLYEMLSQEERFKQKPAPDIESDQEVFTRVITFIREIAIANPGKTVLVVTHGGILRAILLHLGLMTYASSVGRRIENTAFVKLKSDGIDFFVEETEGIKLAET